MRNETSQGPNISGSGLDGLSGKTLPRLSSSAAPEKKRVKNRVGYHGEFWLKGVTNAYDRTMAIGCIKCARYNHVKIPVFLSTINSLENT